jgi:hypothetical protein
MSNRIPPSLAWLIDKRARIDGEMKKTQKSLDRLTRLLGKLEAAEKRLEALDQTIAAHPLTEEPKREGPFVTEHHRRLPLPHGELTRCVLDCLREANGQPVPRAELLNFVFNRHPQFAATEYYRLWIAETVRDCLKRLSDRKMVERHHDRRSRKPGIWSLSQESP